MGAYCSTATDIQLYFHNIVDKRKYSIINDKYESLTALSDALRSNGLERCQLILGIDYTASNYENGGHPAYKHANLHTLSNDDNDKNPYEQVITIIGQTLARFDDDGSIDVFGFGCKKQVIIQYSLLVSIIRKFHIILKNKLQDKTIIIKAKHIFHMMCLSMALIK